MNNHITNAIHPSIWSAQDKGLESARGLEVEREEDDDLGANARRYKRQPLINPMSAVVAQGGSQGEPQAHKKRGRPSKGSFSVTADSDLLDQVARRPVQVRTDIYQLSQLQMTQPHCCVLSVAHKVSCC